MACFSLAYLEQLLVYLVIVGGVIALLKLLLPYVLNLLGVAGGVIMQAINILIAVILAIFVIYFVFTIIGCLTGGGGLHLPRP